MKRIGLIAFLSILGIFLVIGRADPRIVMAPTTNPCELIISTDKSVYRSDEPIRLMMITKNISGHVTIMSYPQSHERFAVTLKGEPVSLTRWGEQLEQIWEHYVGSDFGAVLHGDESRKMELQLSRTVDVSLSGICEVTISRYVADKGDTRFDHLVTSNTVKFEVRD